MLFGSRKHEISIAIVPQISQLKFVSFAKRCQGDSFAKKVVYLGPEKSR